MSASTGLSPARAPLASASSSTTSSAVCVMIWRPRAQYLMRSSSVGLYPTSSGRPSPRQARPSSRYRSLCSWNTVLQSGWSCATSPMAISWWWKSSRVMTKASMAAASSRSALRRPWNAHRRPAKRLSSAYWMMPVVSGLPFTTNSSSLHSTLFSSSRAASGLLLHICRWYSRISAACVLNSTGSTSPSSAAATAEARSFLLSLPRRAQPSSSLVRMSSRHLFSASWARSCIMSSPLSTQ
mmetsp:Transcript_47716/g.121756  ORF Transcript_47716/g.121756 Transcript_47716/m.121756 type:complete len:240 (+) Transcript_47716:698-1417(+)